MGLSFIADVVRITTSPRYARVYQWAERVPASVAARLAGVRADSSFFYYLDASNCGRICSRL